ncbi:hypothetical protein FLBR109950_07385 [Flavobacterium branchiophilum]
MIHIDFDIANLYIKTVAYVSILIICFYLSINNIDD